MAYKTEQRKVLYELLSDNPHEWFSAKQISDLLCNKGISVSSIYRNLSSMVKDGLVRKSIRSDGIETYYQFIASEHCAHKVHMTCTKCGATWHMDNNVANQIQQKIINSDGFVIDTQKTILYGVCKNCSVK